MDSLTLALQGAWKVLLAGLVLGAGLPAIFAFGIRSLAMGIGGDAETDHAAPKPIGKAIAALCFAVVVLAIIVGLTVIVASGFGKQLTFDGLLPGLTDKH
ncbi:hypothetical protein ACMYYO_09465 [Dermacoccaceae bacterium W4C1]